MAAEMDDAPLGGAVLTPAAVSAALPPDEVPAARSAPVPPGKGSAIAAELDDAPVIGAAPVPAAGAVPREPLSRDRGSTDLPPCVALLLALGSGALALGNLSTIAAESVGAPFGGVDAPIGGAELTAAADSACRGALPPDLGSGALVPRELLSPGRGSAALPRCEGLALSVSSGALPPRAALPPDLGSGGLLPRVALLIARRSAALPPRKVAALALSLVAAPVGVDLVFLITSPPVGAWSLPGSLRAQSLSPQYGRAPERPASCGWKAGD